MLELQKALQTGLITSEQLVVMYLARIAAAEVLIELETREGLDALAERLGREPEARVRFLIICGLAADERAESITLLESALGDDDAMNRELPKIISVDDHVVELAAVRHAQEDPGGGENGQHAQRDQQVQRFHHCTPVLLRGSNRREFRATSSELADMPMAATSGGTQPNAAAGIARLLTMWSTAMVMTNDM